MDKYRVVLNYSIYKCPGGADHSADELMAEGEGSWQGLEYDDLCTFEAVMMSKVSSGLVELGLGEMEKKKVKK